MTDRELERVLGDALIGQPIDLTTIPWVIDPDCPPGVIYLMHPPHMWPPLDEPGQPSDDVSSDTAGQDRTP